MATLQPVTELNEEIRSKATASILALEEQWEPGDSVLAWNNLFFRRADGTYYATLHDIAGNTGYPDWLRSSRGVMEVWLWWVDGEIVATGDLADDTTFGAGGGLIDSGNRVWMRMGPQTLERDPDTPPPAPRRSSPSATPPPPPRRPDAPTEVAFRPGQRVRHTTFGEGTVTSSRLVDGDEEVSIAFPDKSRRLLAGFARLQPLD